jgi:uroporphyrinogen decarboxylase
MFSVFSDCQEEVVVVLTPRERVLCALNHDEPDRVPIFVGASAATTLLVPAYECLKTHLGIHSETKVFSRGSQSVLMDERVLLAMRSDGRPLVAGPAPSALAHELPGDAYVDGWGCVWERRPGDLYFKVIDSPLRHATLDDLDNFSWPDLAYPGRFQGLKERAQAIQQAGFAVVALSGVSPFEQAFIARGIEEFMCDLASDQDFALALLRKITDLMKAGVIGLLEEAGNYIDVIITSDDLGSQNAPLMSPAMYRRLIKPFHAELMAEIKRRSAAKIFYHSDGNIYPLIGDLIELGVDLLNPVQVSAKDMGDTALLKQQFGDRLAFCGAVDTQWVLPHGTPEDVRREVRRRIKDLAPGGGYILSAVHCIQPDVPPENICAMVDEAVTAGRYPLAF